LQAWVAASTARYGAENSCLLRMGLSEAFVVVAESMVSEMVGE
jgi:hypothetical protein